MAVLDGFDARNIDRVEADRLLRGGAAQGALYPAHCTASGKVLLAGLDPSAWRRYRANAHLSAFTSRTITSLDTLEPELRLIRHNLANAAKTRIKITLNLKCSSAIVERLT